MTVKDKIDEALNLMNDTPAINCNGIPVIVSDMMKPNEIVMVCGKEYYKQLVKQYGDKS